MDMFKKIRHHFNPKILDGQLQTVFLNFKSQNDWNEVRILLKQGADPNAKNLNSEWQSPILIYAIRHSQTDIVKLMVEKGVDRSLKDEETGFDSLQYAAYLGHDDILDVLLEGNAPSQDVLDIRGKKYLRDADRRNASLCFFGTEDASVENLFERWIDVTHRFYIVDSRENRVNRYKAETFGEKTFLLLRLLLGDTEPSKRLAEIIRPLLWKNNLMLHTCWLMYMNPFGVCKSTLVKFFIKDCECDMNAKNKYGQTLLHLMFMELKMYTYYSNRHPERGLPDDEISDKRQLVKDAATFYLENGFHPCVSDSRGRTIRSLLEEEFPELFPDREIPRLECLAATIIVKAKIPYTEKVSFKLRKFIPLH